MFFAVNKRKKIDIPVSTPEEKKAAIRPNCSCTARQLAFVGGHSPVMPLLMTPPRDRAKD
jgi:hypothetical protein